MSPTSSRTVSMSCRSDPVAGTLALIRSGLFTDYVAYESGGTHYFAGDTAAEIVMDEAAIRWTVAGRAERVLLGPRPMRTLGEVARAVAGQHRLYGYLAFELARLVHGLPGTLEPAGPLAHLIVPAVEVVWTAGTVQVSGTDWQRVDWAVDIVLDAVPLDTAGMLTTEPCLRSADSRARYERSVAELVRAIRAGRLRKAILSRRLDVPFPVDLPASYAAGLARNTPARSFLFQLGERRCAGFSPETVVELDDQGWVSTQPLAGTRPLHGSIEIDRQLREELSWDVKECFEHVISARLADEEIRAVCLPETVSIQELLAVRERGTVQHLASRVAGRLRPGLDGWDALEALFPAVTASGIPKLPALAAIEELEDDQREVYSGVVCVAEPSGALDAALVLRSIFQDATGTRTWLRAGAGIVADSDPAFEYEETTNKLASAARALVTPMASVRTEPATPAHPPRRHVMTIKSTSATGSAIDPAADVYDAMTRSLAGLGIEPDDVTPTSTLQGDLELDSTEMVQVALDLSRHLGPKISLSTLGELPMAELVQNVLAQARDGAESAALAP